MSEPGWYVLTHYDQNYFAQLYSDELPWGDIPSGSTIYFTKIYYGAKISSPTSTSWYLSPEISIRVGYKNRCVVTVISELVPSSQEPASATLGVGFVFFKDGTMLSDEGGNNIFGTSVSFNNVTVTTKSMTVVKFELDGTNVTVKANNTVSFTVSLSDVPTGFKVGLKVESVTAGTASVGVYDVVVEYYDQLTYMFTTVSNLIFSFMPVMIMMPMFKAFKFKPRKKVTEEKSSSGEETEKGSEKEVTGEGGGK